MLSHISEAPSRFQPGGDKSSAEGGNCAGVGLCDVLRAFIPHAAGYA